EQGIQTLREIDPNARKGAMWFRIALYKPIPPAGLDQPVIAIKIETLSRGRFVAEFVAFIVGVSGPDTSFCLNCAPLSKRQAELLRKIRMGSPWICKWIERNDLDSMRLLMRTIMLQIDENSQPLTCDRSAFKKAVESHAEMELQTTLQLPQ